MSKENLECFVRSIFHFLLGLFIRITIYKMFGVFQDFINAKFFVIFLMPKNFIIKQLNKNY